MNADAIDRLSRLLSDRVSRRSAARLAIGGVAAGWLGRPMAATARCKRLRRRCTSTKECCGAQTACHHVPGCEAGRHCCAKAVEPCVFGCDCCGQLYCAYSSCDSSRTRCCQMNGGACNNNCVCCSGLSCVGGICQ